MSEISKLIAEIKSEGILRSGNKLEQLYSLAEQKEKDYAALQQNLDALAAENAALKSGIADITFMRDDDFFASTQEAQRVMGFLVNIKTPATDAYLNSVRADAVESFTSDVVLKMRESGAGAYDYADIVEAQGQELVLSLRSGTHDTANKAG